MSAILFNISFLLIGMFPFFSHSQLAAIIPIIVDVILQLVTIIDIVEYASKASPAPTGSITCVAKLSRVK